MALERKLSRQAASLRKNAAAYQNLLDKAAAFNSNEGIRQGLEDMNAGNTRPAQDGFIDLRAPDNLSS